MTIIFLGTSFRRRAPVEDTILQGRKRHLERGLEATIGAQGSYTRQVEEPSENNSPALHRYAQGDSSRRPRMHHGRPGQPSSQQADPIKLAQSQCSIVDILMLGASSNLRILPPHLQEQQPHLIKTSAECSHHLL